ncbi:hypothetical protein [Streptomyces sp. WMMB303]|uniref:hypothetical protein n=1 Tax=Streptomyces sp. WMMB303 TaxID=3034154 RepID=UPI0023EB8419|nr:hypothetical protein [Streptomyces sp. WMMB303]MDF4251131.1 hypothetical protein [Streptomyces sp. WMMB303]
MLASGTRVPGTLVVDGGSGRFGVVIGAVGPYTQLRPYGGGREWDADPARLRVATPRERLHVAVAAANAWSRNVPRAPGWPGWPR